MNVAGALRESELEIDTDTYITVWGECFTEIAPYLDLDYYYIDAFSLLPKVSFE